MNYFSITIENIQHIGELAFSIDLGQNTLLCLVGKNGAGKTTFVKAIANFVNADTFSQTSMPYIFSEHSKVSVSVEDQIFEYTYDPSIRTLDCHTPIPQKVLANIYAELPLPFGERFQYFRHLSGADDEIRRAVALENYEKQEELVAFLNAVYETDRFDVLKAVKVRGEEYYVIPREEGYYIREDYFSSGEYFLITIYRMIKRRCRLIVIDEIDISLDSIAQVNLIGELRKFCREYGVNILFTTHSLAIMKVMENDELCYMENVEGKCRFEKKSYAYIKALLYKFKGWDKYILTEDVVLQEYMEELLRDEPVEVRYKIIYIAGGSNVVDLMLRNRSEEFLADYTNVLTVLDGDQKEEAYVMDVENLLFLPFESVEKQLKIHYDSGELSSYEIGIKTNMPNNHKDIFNRLSHRFMSRQQIFKFLNNRHKSEVEVFKRDLLGFLND